MLFVRSLAYNIAFYVSTIAQMVVWTPVYFLGPRSFAWWIVRNWSRSNMWLMKVFVGTDHVVHGKQKLPQGGYIIAPKHQSAWDTFAFLPWWPDPVYILKRQLMWIPLFGWYVARMKMIAIDRSNREQAVRMINARAREAIQEGRQIVLYPEGTRRPPGAAPAYKHGIAHIYQQLGVPVVPIAHMAGLYWPRRKFLRYPGLIEVEVLDPIEPGLSRDRFIAELERRTEAACDRLLLRAVDGPNPPPLPPEAAARVAALKAAQGDAVKPDAP